jgi:hypothetical protein
MKNKLYLAVALGLGLSACVDRVDSIRPKYETKAPIPISANAILVTQDFNPYSKAPNSDQLFSRTLVQNVESWAKKRLYPLSQQGIAQLTIRDASFTLIPNTRIPEEMEGHLDVVLSILNDQKTVLSTTEARVKQKVSVPVGMTDEERKVLTQTLTTKLIDALDSEMEELLLKTSSFIPYPKQRS